MYFTFADYLFATRYDLIEEIKKGIPKMRQKNGNRQEPSRKGGGEGRGNWDKWYGKQGVWNFLSPSTFNNNNNNLYS